MKMAAAARAVGNDAVSPAGGALPLLRRQAIHSSQFPIPNSQLKKLEVFS